MNRARPRPSDRATRHPAAWPVVLAGLVLLYATFGVSSSSYTTSTGNGPATMATLTLDAPTSLAATAGDASAAATWSAPATNLASVAGYTVTASPGGATCSTVAPTTSCTVSGLTNGIAYTLSVVATNTGWSSPASNSVSVTPYPSSVLSPAALKLWLDGADATTLLASSTCTGAAATPSVGCWKDKSGNADHAVASVSAAVGTTMNARSTVTFSGTPKLSVTRPALADSTTYAVVRTTQSLGVGDGSAQWWDGASVFDGDVAGVAAADGGFTLAGGHTAFGTGNPDTTATAQRTMNDGTAHVMTGLRVSATGSLTASSDGTASNTATGAITGSLGATPVYIGLSSNGKPYVGDIAEIVVVGSALSATDQRTVLEYLARKWGGTITPAAPVSPSASAGTGTATVTWTAPAWNGNASITAYTVAPVSGAGTCTWSSGTTASCTGLTHGASYTFTVKATNSVGTGPAATTASVTP